MATELDVRLILHELGQLKGTVEALIRSRDEADKARDQVEARLRQDQSASEGRILADISRLATEHRQQSQLEVSRLDKLENGAFTQLGQHNAMAAQIASLNEQFRGLAQQFRDLDFPTVGFLKQEINRLEGKIQRIQTPWGFLIAAFSIAGVLLWSIKDYLLPLLTKGKAP